MDPLSELFDLYRPTDGKMRVYTRHLHGLEGNALKSAISMLLESWDKTTMPPIGLIRQRYATLRAERREDEEREESRSRGLDSRTNTAAELELFGFIHALNHRHRVMWDFALSRWVGPNDQGYGQTYRQDYGSRACMENRASTMDEARAAWRKYAGGAPEPRPFATAFEATHATTFTPEPMPEPRPWESGGSDDIPF